MTDLEPTGGSAEDPVANLDTDDGSESSECPPWSEAGMIHWMYASVSAG